MAITAVVAANQTLTAAGVFTDTQTVVIGGKTYTSQTTLTNADGNFLIGASASISLDNLKAAINLDPTAGQAGTTYAAATTVGHAVATTKTATTLLIVSRLPGTIGNLIATTETQTNASFGAATMTGGTGSLAQAINDIKALAHNSAIQQALRNIDDDSVNN